MSAVGWVEAAVFAVMWLAALFMVGGIVRAIRRSGREFRRREREYAARYAERQRMLANLDAARERLP